MYRRFFKRVIDFVIALALVITLLPALVIISLILLVVNRGNPFFFQERPGKHEVIIRVVKFRSMTDKRDKSGNLLPDNARITRFGAFLRKTSLDELPQLINVLIGEMSLVGPRPLLFKYIPLYTPEQRRRHLVRPGITGWAQVNGRNAISWEEKFKYDVYYVDNISFWLDMRIVFLTVHKVLLREGINESEERPMSPFTGSK